MSGGSIARNRVYFSDGYGGGVAVATGSSSTITMTGGSIGNNYAPKKSGGVISLNNTFTLGGSVSITNNKAGTDDVDVFTDLISIGEGLEVDTPIKVKMQLRSDSTKDNGVFTSGWGDNMGKRNGTQPRLSCRSRYRAARKSCGFCARRSTRSRARRMRTGCSSWWTTTLTTLPCMPRWSRSATT